MLVGKCLCGTVRYVVEGPFGYAGYCHCSRCRAASGSAFSAFAGVESDKLLRLDGQLRTEPWLNTAQFPQMTFRSTGLELTGPNAARMIGELGLHGVTGPVTLDVTFNGGYAGHPWTRSARASAFPRRVRSGAPNSGSRKAYRLLAPASAWATTWRS